MAHVRKFFFTIHTSPMLWFLLSLIFFCVVSFILRTSGSEMDEIDHLAIASLMHDERTLYTNLFSHHFPFPYFWTYLFAFSWNHLQHYQGIILFRLSITSLFLLSFALIFFAQETKRTQLALSSWIFFFSSFFFLYRGNLVMSETFVGIGILGISWILIPITIDWEKLTSFKTILCHGFATIAFWSQPLSLLLFFPIFLFFNHKKKILFHISLLTLLNSVPILFFQIRGQLPYFFEQALFYNFTTYASHYPSPQIANSFWLFSIGKAFILNQIHFITHSVSIVGFSQLVLHVSYLFLAVVLFKKKKWRHVCALLLLYFAPRLRDTKVAIGELLNYGVFPILTLFSIVFVLLMIWHWNKHKLFILFASIGMILMNVYPGISFFREGLAPGYSYHYYWSDQQRTGEVIQKLTKENEKILIATNQVDLYFFSRRQPADKFLYWYPWTYIVDKYQLERLNTLQRKKPIVIFVGDILSQKKIPEYQKVFLQIKNNYSLVEADGVPKGMWLRNDEISRLSNL